MNYNPNFIEALAIPFIMSTLQSTLYAHSNEI